MAPEGPARDVERVGADLMPEPPRAGVDHHRDLTEPDAERARSRLVMDLVDHLDLEEVIAGAERAELTSPSLAGPLGHGRGIRAGNASVGLEPLEVCSQALTTADGPRRPLLHHRVELAALEGHAPVGPDTGRY